MCEERWREVDAEVVLLHEWIPENDVRRDVQAGLDNLERAPAGCPEAGGEVQVGEDVGIDTQNHSILSLDSQPYDLRNLKFPPD